MTKITDLSEAQLSKDIAEQWWPDKQAAIVFNGHDPAACFIYPAGVNIQESSHTHFIEIDKFNCTIPNDIFPIWSECVMDIYEKRTGWWIVSTSRDAVECENAAGKELLEATKSCRKMSELILWYYVGDEYDE